MSWSRRGNFFKNSEHPSAFTPSRAVTFTNQAKAAVISSIVISYYGGSTAYIKPLLSPLFLNNLSYIKQLGDGYSDASEWNTDLYGDQGELVSRLPNIYIEQYGLDLRADLVPNIIKLFDDFHKKYQMESFPKEMGMELFNICHAVAENNFENYQHIVSTLPKQRSDNINPIKKDDKSIINLLFSNRAPLKELEKLLIKGFDPNQANKSGETPSMLAVIKFESVKLLELLLVYGANPFARNGTAWSAIEYAQAFNLKSKLDTIITFFSKVERPIANQLKIVKTDFSHSEKEFITIFHFSNNQVISTAMKNVGLLSINEKNSLFKLFSSIFEVPNDNSQNKIRKLFEEDFSEEKIIELIHDSKQIIGFNLFEIMNPKKNNKHVVLHCVWGFIIPEYQGYGLMTLLSFRPAYSLQLLLNDKKCGIFLSSLHYKSYQMLLDFLHYPRHQLDYMDGLMDEILHDIYKDDTLYYFHDNLNFYVLEQLKVKSTNKIKPNSDIYQEFFYQNILGVDNMDEEIIPTRAVPTFHFTSKEHFKKVTIRTKNLGTDFLQHITELANHMSSYLKNIKTNKSNSINLCNLTRSGNSLFWQKKLISRQSVNNNLLVRAKY